MKYVADRVKDSHKKSKCVLLPHLIFSSYHTSTLKQFYDIEKLHMDTNSECYNETDNVFSSGVFYL